MAQKNFGSRNLRPEKWGPNKVSNSWDITDIDKCSLKKNCPGQMFQEPTFKVWSNLGQSQLRYSSYRQMSPGLMLPGQMSQWQLDFVLDVPWNLHLKFDQNRVSNSWEKFVVEDPQLIWWRSTAYMWWLKVILVLSFGLSQAEQKRYIYFETPCALPN